MAYERTTRSRAALSDVEDTTERLPPSPAPDSPRPAPACDGGGPEWCTLVFARTENGGEFQVVMLERGARRHVVARSPSFRVPRSGRLRRHGEARRAHDLLVRRLVAWGWQRMQTRGRWHDTGLIRSRPNRLQPPLARVLIECERDRRTARFHADELDMFGNGTALCYSQTFSVRLMDFGVRPTDEAIAAHEGLLQSLCSLGWSTTALPSQEWYARVLDRPEAEPQDERESRASRAVDAR